LLLTQSHIPLPVFFQTSKKPFIRNDVPINIVIFLICKLEQLIDWRLDAMALLVCGGVEKLEGFEDLLSVLVEDEGD
jgi:hypothetical protein